MIDFADQVRDHVEYKEMELGFSFDVENIVDTVRDESPETVDDAFELVDELISRVSGRSNLQEDEQDDFLFEDDDGLFDE